MSVILHAARPYTTEDYSSVSRLPLSLGLYPDNTPVVDLEDAWNHAGGEFKAIEIHALSIQDLVTGLMVSHAIKQRGGSVKNALIPHIPGGRQDRIKWEGDWLFTIKYVANLINAERFEKVITLDPHSLATTALIDNCIVPELNMDWLLSEYAEYAGVIAPDAGAEKRAGIVAQQLKVPLYSAKKHRDPVSNKLSGFSVDELPSNAHYLVVDDICDAGGTFVGLGEVIAENSATADLFVTHGIFSKNAGERLKKHYNKVFSTDSVDRLADGVTYFNVSEGLVRYV